MAQLNFTLESEFIKGLFLPSTHRDAMANWMEQLLNQVLEAQVNEVVGAERYQRSEERNCYRNAYRSRTLKTRIGTLELHVPHLRRGEFPPELFPELYTS